MKRFLYLGYAVLRRLVQLAVLAGFCVLPWATEHEKIRGVYGSLFAVELWGLPFADPAAAAQVAAGGHVPGGRLLVGALLALTLALLMGRIFCSWICPLGLLSELAHKPARFFARRRGKAGNRADKREFWGKTAVLAACLALFALWSLPLLGLISLPGELSLLPLLVWQGDAVWAVLGAAAVPLLALLVEIATGRRLWCRSVCPQSVLLGLAATCLPKAAPGLRIAWRPKSCTCKKESPCAAACSLGLSPRHVKGPPRRDCTHCGDCLKTCARHGGALGFRLKPAPK